MLVDIVRQDNNKKVVNVPLEQFPLLVNEKQRITLGNECVHRWFGPDLSAVAHPVRTSLLNELHITSGLKLVVRP